MIGIADKVMAFGKSLISAYVLIQGRIPNALFIFRGVCRMDNLIDTA
jgi:hypothetical protein